MGGEKSGISGKSTKRIIFGTFICLLLFVFAIVTSYYGIEFVRQLSKTHTELSERVDRLETETKEAIDVLVRTVASVNNVTGALEIFFNNHNKHIPRAPRRRRRDESSFKEVNKTAISREDPLTTEESLQRTIHGFRREMFSLNDRLRLLLRYGDKNIQKGEPGLPGPLGKIGPPGSPGVNGRDGYHGARGEQGTQGPTGPVGPVGSPGKDGLNGINGIPGLPGYKGDKGDRGSMGNNGRDGTDGNQGQIGRTGSPGRPGIPGEKGEKGECIIKDDEPEPTEAPTGSPGAHIVYTMWGSSNCPSTSRIIYSGHIGMSKYRLDNGQVTGSNLVCMPIPSKRHRRQATVTINRESNKPDKTTEELEPPTFEYKNTTLNITINETIISDPQIMNVTEPLTPLPLILTPTEPPSTSESTPTTKFSPTSTEPILMNVTGPPLPIETTANRFIPRYADLVGTRKYVPCSVCDAIDKAEKLMIPSTNECPDTWSVEYQGYLMNYHHGTKHSNLICVNDQALGISPSSDAGIREIISKYLTHVKTDCSTFPCPPLNYKELLKCVVCSK